MSRGQRSLWSQWALLPAFGLVTIYVALLPLAPGSGATKPDLLYCLAAAWVIRAPAGAPVLILLALGLLADVMLSRPLGLGTLGLLIATEVLRGRGSGARDWPFPWEWLVATTAFALMLAGMSVAILLSLADWPGAAALSRHLLATAVAYPLVALGVGALVGGGPRRESGRSATGRLP